MGQGMEGRAKGLSHQDGFGVTGESGQILDDVTGWLFKIYPVSQEEGYFSFRKMRTKAKSQPTLLDFFQIASPF